MIKIDIKRYIHNRMWFGWWFSYACCPIVPVYTGRWRRDSRRAWVPVILVSVTITKDEFYNNLSPWARQYGDI